MNDEKSTRKGRKFDVLKLEEAPATKAMPVGKIMLETLEILEFLDSMEVDTSARLDNLHHSKRIKSAILTSKRSKSSPVDLSNKSFTCGIGIDHEYHVWRDS